MQAGYIYREGDRGQQKTLPLLSKMHQNLRRPYILVKKKTVAHKKIHTFIILAPVAKI